MKNFFADIPNKWKAVYLGWVFLNFILLITTKKPFRFNKDFYPFDWRGLRFDSSVYDYSEFLIYSLSPIVIYLIYWLWKKKDA